VKVREILSVLHRERYVTCDEAGHVVRAGPRALTLAAELLDNQLLAALDMPEELAVSVIPMALVITSDPIFLCKTLIALHEAGVRGSVVSDLTKIDEEVETYKAAGAAPDMLVLSPRCLLDLLGLSCRSVRERLDAGQVLLAVSSPEDEQFSRILAEYVPGLETLDISSEGLGAGEAVAHE